MEKGERECEISHFTAAQFRGYLQSTTFSFWFGVFLLLLLLLPSLSLSLLVVVMDLEGYPRSLLLLCMLEAKCASLS